MKTVISVRDLEEMVRNGQDVRVLPDDVILTPSAKDFLRDSMWSTTMRTVLPLGNTSKSRQ